MYADYDPDLYCKLFVDADNLTRSELRTLLLGCLGNLVTDAEHMSLDSSTFAIDVRRNEDFDPLQCQEPAGFVFFRYYLDIDAVPGQPLSVQVALVSQILECLWGRGYAAVAACDFEDNLPRRGGYNSGR